MASSIVDAIHIGEEHTAIGGASLAVGAASLARAHLRQAPPSALELKNAIAAVDEDEIRGAARAARVQSSLRTDDARIRELARQCGATDVLSVEAVEQAFGQLAARGVPADGEAAATLVILREVMHHLGIKTLVLGKSP